jgi:hypothetical protein
MPISKNSVMVWDGIMEVAPAADGAFDCTWHGTLFVNEEEPDATKVPEPARNAFKAFCASDQEFRVTGTAKPADGAGDGNKFKPYLISFTAGEGWEYDGTKQTDAEHNVLTSLQWQGSPDKTKSLVFAHGKDTHGPFISTGWMRPGNRITLARRYLDTEDDRAKWDANMVRDEVTKLVWDAEEEECVIPPWQCMTLSAK